LSAIIVGTVLILGDSHKGLFSSDRSTLPLIETYSGIPEDEMISDKAHAIPEASVMPLKFGERKFKDNQQQKAAV